MKRLARVYRAGLRAGVRNTILAQRVPLLRFHALHGRSRLAKHPRVDVEALHPSLDLHASFAHGASDRGDIACCALQFLQQPRAYRLVLPRVGATLLACYAGFELSFREVLDIDYAAVREHHSDRQNVLELTHVSGPRVLQKPAPSLARELVCAHVVWRNTAENQGNDEPEVLPPLSQW